LNEIRDTSIIYNDVKIGDGTRIFDFSVIREGCRIGKNCTIGNHVRLNGECIIGDDTTITCGVHLSRMTKVGKNVFIAPGTVVANTRQLKCQHKESCDNMGCVSPVMIGNNVKIGINCTILAGVTIEDNVLIGAGSLVTKDVPENIYGFGSPFRDMGDIRDLKCKDTGKLLYGGIR